MYLHTAVSVSITVIDQLLEKHNYRQRKAQKRRATGEHAQRNQQFEKIERLKKSYLKANNPILSMDTKKKNWLDSYIAKVKYILKEI